MSSWCWLHDVSCIGTNINKEYSSATAMHKCPLNAACSRILYVKNRRKSKSVQRLSKVDTSAVLQQLLPFLRGFVSDLWEAESSWALQLESLTSEENWPDLTRSTGKIHISDHQRTSGMSIRRLSLSPFRVSRASSWSEESFDSPPPKFTSTKLSLPQAEGSLTEWLYYMSTVYTCTHVYYQKFGCSGHRFVCAPHRSWGFNVCNKIRQTCVSKVIVFCVTPIVPESFMIVSSINVLVWLFQKVGGFGGRSYTVVYRYQRFRL